jgi:acetyl esterase/lipase
MELLLSSIDFEARLLIFAVAAARSQGSLAHFCDGFIGGLSCGAEVLGGTVFDITTIAVEARQDKALSRDGPDGPEWLLLGCFASECRAVRIAAASPITYVGPNTAPILLIAGTEHTTVRYQRAPEMAEKLKAAGVPHELIVLPGLNLSFIGKTEHTREANLKALDATFRYFGQTMKDSR